MSLLVSGETNNSIVRKTDDVLNQKPESLTAHVGTNDLINDINLLNNIKQIVAKTRQKSLNTILIFSNITIRKDKRSLEKLRADTNSRIKNHCSQKNLSLIIYDNIKENHFYLSYI